MDTRDRTIEALVIGGVDYSEADRVVHLLTELGRISAFAHGAKKSRRRFAGALDVFTTISATLGGGRARQGSLQTLSSATVLRPRLGLRADLARIALASYVAELAGKVAPEGESAPLLYVLAGSTLDLMERAPATVAVRRAFELLLISEIGYAPELERCVACGDPPARRYLDLARGGVTCATHREHAGEVGPRTLEWMGRLLERGIEPTLDVELDLGAEWADRAARSLTGTAASFFHGLFDRPLNAERLLADVAL